VQAVRRTSTGDRFERDQGFRLGIVERQLERSDPACRQRVGDRERSLWIEMTPDRDDPARRDAVRDGRSDAAQVGLTIIG
jgi:hypothetical protein